MQDFSLADVGILAISILIFLASVVIGGGLWAYRQELWLILHAIWRRYVTFTWHGVDALSTDMDDDYVTYDADREGGSQNAVPPQGNAMEPHREPVDGNLFPTDTAVIAYLGTLSETALLDILACVRQDDTWAFAESRIGKFIPGRVEDNIARVRAVRGEAGAASSPARVIRVDGGKGELVVDW